MKKILGITLIVISAIFALLFFIAVLTIIPASLLEAIKDPNVTTISTVVGNFLGFVLLMAIPGLLFFFGLKLTKRRKEIVLQQEEY
jgi:hypothetical protein